MRNYATSRSAYVTEVEASPTKTRQETLDGWRLPDNSPNKPRKSTPLDIAPKPRPPRFKITDGGMETLDLTPSSPLALSPEAAIVHQERKRTSNRPPLISLSANASLISEAASSATAGTSSRAKAKAVAKSQPTPPRLRRTQSVSPEIESLDLSEPSLPPPNKLESAFRRSPSAHTTTSPEASAKTTPPLAVWKTQVKKKREVVLRKSLAGAWAFVDVQTPAKATIDDGEVPKGKERKRWRESEIEFIDLC
jgi:Holliday junction resolvase YEN1